MPTEFSMNEQLEGLPAEAVTGVDLPADLVIAEAQSEPRQSMFLQVAARSLLALSFEMLLISFSDAALERRLLATAFLLAGLWLDRFADRHKVVDRWIRLYPDRLEFKTDSDTGNIPLRSLVRIDRLHRPVETLCIRTSVGAPILFIEFPGSKAVLAKFAALAGVPEFDPS